MKKAFTFTLLLAAGIAAHAQNTAGLDRWITGFPAGQTTLFNTKITRCAVERTGALVVLDWSGTPVRLNLIKRMTLEELHAKIVLVEKAVFNDGTLQTDGWSIAISECEIDFGLQDEITVTPRLSAFRFRLNANTILDLTGRLETAPVFIRRRSEKKFTYTLRFRGVAAGMEQRVPFPGWDGCVQTLVSWFEKGMKDKNQEVQALAIETKVMSMGDKQAQKRMVLSKEDKSNLWFGFKLDYAMANLIGGEPFGVYVNPLAYHQLRPLFYYSWRDLGDETWITQPYQVTLSFGGFFEFNASYFNRMDTEFAGYEMNGSFMLAGGPCVGVEITAMVPRVLDDRHAGDIMGFGAELLVAFNVPYLFDGYYYEYFLTTSLNLVIHILPLDGAGLDLLVGANAALATDLFDAAMGNIHVSQYGFNVGVRLNFDIFNFFKSDRMFE